jgi:hypothetical protein
MTLATTDTSVTEMVEKIGRQTTGGTTRTSSSQRITILHPKDCVDICCYKEPEELNEAQEKSEGSEKLKEAV